MKTRIFKTAGAVKSEPISHRSWHELVDDFDQQLAAAADSETEEAAVDLWLENPRVYMEVGPDPENTHIASPMMRRVRTGGMGFQRHNSMEKTAAVSSWDEEIADVKAHVNRVLGNIRG